MYTHREVGREGERWGGGERGGREEKERRGGMRKGLELPSKSLLTNWPPLLALTAPNFVMLDQS